MKGIKQSGVTTLPVVCVWVIASISVLFQNTALAETEKPRLILQITVDQLRGDLPARFLDRMGEGGFRYFLEEGIVYGNAHHAHANTETIVGHATLATGAHPSAHGMIGNIWFDRGNGSLTYNIEDDRYGLLTEGADVDDKTEIDPTQNISTFMFAPGVAFSLTLAVSTHIDHQYGKSLLGALRSKFWQLARNGVLFAGISSVYEQDTSFRVSIGKIPT